MIIQNVDDIEETKIETFPYKGEQLPVRHVTVRWLSKCGEDENGLPEYGLRFFTVGPGGEVPIHKHFYVQTMYILTGEFECHSYDPDTDTLSEARIAKPGDAVYIPSMAPHGMRNTSTTGPGTFLCCICNVYEETAV